MLVDDFFWRLLLVVKLGVTFGVNDEVIVTDDKEAMIANIDILRDFIFNLRVVRFKSYCCSGG